MDQIEEMADNLKLLGDKTRLSILTLLKEKELCVCDIVEALEISQPNASQHLRKLKAAGFVNETKKAQWVYYSLKTDEIPYIKAVLDLAPSMQEKLAQLQNNHC
ncbi:ArsR/SmtB family transcription factor [Paenibacillus abyssi]|uniref:Transcriptional regulator n=1 Tax=Paenibacillus abyssi TaxID=1340531 RepID=A0A917CRX8_9BACL|nr:metalloregulator ArsR/SmtB family transcription factor [Paenibacillus abyssi]GGF95870.1 transcriptional regulator [Paenibacillus abyssi]